MNLPYLSKPESVWAGILQRIQARQACLSPQPCLLLSLNPASKAYLLCPAFICSLVLVVDPAEVGDYHRDWQSNDQDTTQGADGAEYLPCDGLRHHVSISVRERERGGEEREDVRR